MEGIDSHLTQKLWGLKFLIEQFYYDNKRSQKKRAILIDKMQTFWMLYAPFLKEGEGPTRAMVVNFRKFLRGKRAPLYDLQEKPSIDRVDSWFSSPVTRKHFIDIYNNDHFDFSNPDDVVLAFNLADGVLEKPEIREYAVLESLYFRKKGIESFSEAKADTLQEEFAREFKKPDNDFLHSLLDGVSEQEVQEAFRTLTNDVVAYFHYQKRNGYPMINIKLFELWVEDVFSLLDSIISDIKAMIALDEYSLIECYFPNILSKERPTKDFNYHSLHVYLDDNFKKRFTNAKNELAHLIMMMFSHVSLDYFGICGNKSCRQKRLFVKFPKANKEYCSNLCAAYAATYKKRSEEQKKDLMK